MAITYTLYTKRGLAHIQFSGHVSAAETLEKVAQFAADPGVHPDLHQILDFSAVESFEPDYVKLLALLARVPEHLVHAGHEPIFVYVCPTRTGLEMAQFVIRSMEGMEGGPILRICQSRGEALAMLGLPEGVLQLT